MTDAAEQLSNLRGALIRLAKLEAEDLTREALAAGVDPEEILESGLTAAMLEVGHLWDSGGMFLPQVMVAARIFSRCSALVEPALLAGAERERGERIVLATVQGDVHDLGKTIVGSMLRTRGFEVHDLGKDIPASRVLETVTAVGARMVGLSAMLTSTMPQQRAVIEALSAAGVRGDVKVIVGGAPVSARWASDIGADGYAANAAEAIQLAESLLRPSGAAQTS